MGENEVIKWQQFERIADDLATQEFSVVDDFLAPEEVKALKAVFHYHLEQENFKKAGIGTAQHFTVDREVRGDWIRWMDPQDPQEATTAFLERINQLMHGLNRLLFLSLKDFECHFALYPPGSYYEKHIDQFRNADYRKLSFAFYLNEEWQAGDGGELRIYQEQDVIDIPPLSGRLILFRSDTVAHEVLTTSKDRYSVTGWLRDQPLDLPLF